ncbi:MAG: YihY/virulence factor BrkB family protein [Pseudomonadota bacterium]
MWQKFWTLLDLALFGTHTLGDNLLARLLRLVRYPYALLRDLLNGELTLRATGLVYTTFLALIPAVALTFAVLKAFGAHRELEPLILDFFRPIGDKAAQDITQRLMQFADSVRSGLVGVVGFGALLWMLIGTVRKIEDSINFTWRVRSARSIPRRITEFAVLIIIGPLVIAAVIAFTKVAFDSVAGHTPQGFAAGARMLKAFIVLAPYAIVTGLFTVMYLLLPNTRVKLVPALVGGFTAGMLWAATGKIFTTLVLASSQMKLVYAGFAIIAALFVWTYLGWLILLIGAQLAFYVQNPNYLRLGHAVLRLSSRELELLAMDVMVHVGEALRAGFAPWSVDALSRKLGLPGIAVADMATNLERGGLLAQADDGTLFPARELTGIKLTQILDCARSDSSGHIPLTRASTPSASRLQMELERSWHQACGDRTLADLIASPP